jgi:hypothetical protein
MVRSASTRPTSPPSGLARSPAETCGQRLTGALPWIEVSGLSEEARDVFEIARRIDVGSEEPHPEIHSDEIDDALGRPPGSEVTQQALAELEQIGDLENVTHPGPADGATSFTLA